MRTLGVYLIFAAVALRGAVVTSDAPYFTPVLELLAGYGLLLIARTWLTRSKLQSLFESHSIQFAYLLLQSALVIELLVVSGYEDLFANLFIPLSLDAVSFFGRRFGYFCIAAFALALTSTLFFSDQGHLFGLAMGSLYSGVCFLFGGYASQVFKAQAARDQNQRTFDELQLAHRQLQGYADQMASLAVEHERNRLARDLHDSVTQTVFSMNLAAQSARLLLEKEPLRTSCSAQLQHLEELATNALGEIQSLVSQLKPRSIAEEGLPTAVRRLADERQSRDGLQVSLEIHGERKLSEAETLGLYSIAHEALINVAKHSGVHEACVHLNLDDDHSCLEIEDHGRGFDPQAALKQRGHLGMAGMAERAREIGWSLSVQSSPLQGTRILVTQDEARGQK
jgi:signal transduction histidine kinase